MIAASRVYPHVCVCFRPGGEPLPHVAGRDHQEQELSRVQPRPATLQSQYNPPLLKVTHSQVRAQRPRMYTPHLFPHYFHNGHAMLFIIALLNVIL